MKLISKIVTSLSLVFALIGTTVPVEAASNAALSQQLQSIQQQILLLQQQLQQTGTNGEVLAATAKTVQADQADKFVDSIAVNIHANFSGDWDTKYSTWSTKLGDSGIRYVRTRLATNGRARDYLLDLYNRYGIKSGLTINPVSDGVLQFDRIDPELSFIKNQLGTNKVVHVEGPNEFSQTKYSGNSDWATELTNFQDEVYDSSKTILGSSVPVLTSSIWRRIPSDFTELGAQSADVANLHYYTAGRIPTIWAHSGTEYPIEYALELTDKLAPNKPIQITESGYNNVADTVDSPFAVPEYSQAKYTNRLFAETYLRGVERNYLYVFMDRSEHLAYQYGLLRSDASATAKPAYYAVQNMISVMEDPGPDFTPDDFTYALSGDQTNVRHMVFQKRNGDFYFMIWLDGESYVRNSATEVDVPPRALTLDVSTENFASAQVYYPTAHKLSVANKAQGAQPVETISDPSVMSINVPDHVMIIKFSGEGATNPDPDPDPTPTNNPPVATDNTFQAQADQILTNVNPVRFDSDPDGDELTAIEQFDVPGSNGGVFQIQWWGRVTFDPAGDFDDLLVGQTRSTSFEYTITDGTDTDSATVTVVVSGVNQSQSTDTDTDGIPDSSDNCPTVSNAAQTDTDGDGIGDACDSTPNGDPAPTSPFSSGDRVQTTDTLNVRSSAGGSILGTQSNGAVGTVGANTPADSGGYTFIYVNFDSGVDGWVADEFLATYEEPQAADADGDGVPDESDNCPNTPNADQADTDNDGVGNVCDSTPNGDVTAPTLSSISVSNIGETTARVTWTTNELSTSEVLYGTSNSYGDTSGETNTVTTNHSVTLSGLLEDTVYHFQVRSRDAAGNTAASQDFTFSTLATPEPEGDTTAPTISNFQAADLGGSFEDNRFEVTFTTNEPASVVMKYGTNRNNLSNTVSDSGLKSNHTYTFGGLTRKTTYYYQVTASDAAGNSRTSDIQSFTTGGRPGKVTGLTARSGSIILEWDEVDETVDEIIIIRLTGNRTADTDDDPLVTLDADETSYTDETAEDGQKYTYTMYSVTDGEYSEPTTITFTREPDTTPELTPVAKAQAKAEEHRRSGGSRGGSANITNTPATTVAAPHSVVTTDNLNVRTTPGGALIRVVPNGSQGTKTSDTPVTQGGYTWIKVEFAGGVSGWVAENFTRANTAASEDGNRTAILSQIQQLLTTIASLQQRLKEMRGN